MSGKYSISSIKNSAYGLVFYFLTLENEGIVGETEQFMEESGLRSELMGGRHDAMDGGKPHKLPNRTGTHQENWK